MGIITDVFLPLALAFIMFALGLGLTGDDFARVVKQPRPYCHGLADRKRAVRGQVELDRRIFFGRIASQAGDW